MTRIYTVEFSVDTEEHRRKFEEIFHKVSSKVAEHEDGAFIYHLCKQNDGKQYFLFEGYRDKKAFKAHMQAPYVPELVEAINGYVGGDPLVTRLSPVGEKAVKALANLKGAELKKKIGVMATLNVKEGKQQEFLDFAAKQVESVSVNEPHCLFYEVSKNAKSSTEFIFVEIYEDLKAVKEHGETSYFKQFLGSVTPLLQAKPRIIQGEIIGGGKLSSL